MHTTEETHTRHECWPALFLFLFAMAVFFARAPDRAREATTAGAAALFAVLTGLTLGLSVTAVRERLRTRSQAVNVLAAPLAIAAAIAMCCAVIGLPVAPRAAAFGVYLTVPAVLVCAGRGRIPDTVRVLGAAIVDGFKHRADGRGARGVGDDEEQTFAARLVLGEAGRGDDVEIRVREFTAFRRNYRVEDVGHG